MNKRTLQVLVALSLITSASFAAKERVIRFQNHVRVGYDDNIYKNADAVSSAFITDIINLSGKFNFSTRTDALLYWQPEFQYRFDTDPKFVTYQDLYGRLNHAISQRAFLTISDRFRYQQKEGQTGATSGAVQQDNQNFIENDLLGALTYQVGKKGDIKVGAGYGFRVWDDENYGKGTAGNDYQQITGDLSYLRQFIENRTKGMIGVNYVNQEFDGSRGGYDAVSAVIGVDQNFNANFTGFGRIGGSFNSVENRGTTSDTTTPYLQAGVEYNPTARTSLTGSLGYSIYRSENSIYNAQDRFNIGLGARHDITAKINLSSSLSYINSQYKADYAPAGVSAPDATDDYVAFSLRCAYQINRNNFVEAGYLFQKRMSDTFSEWDGNRVDLAWRLRL